MVHFILVAFNPRVGGPDIQVQEWLNPGGVLVNQYCSIPAGQLTLAGFHLVQTYIFSSHFLNCMCGVCVKRALFCAIFLVTVVVDII